MNRGDLPNNVELYEGFILPSKDVRDLKLNGFKYEVEEKVFRGTMEDAEGDLHAFEYDPELYHFKEMFAEENY